MGGNDDTARDQVSTALVLLGRFELLHHDTPQRVSMAVQRLLAFLAIEAQTKYRSAIAGWLWGDLPEARASAVLRSTLWELRRGAPTIVSSSRQHLRLAPGVAVDLHKSVEAARQIIGGTDVPVGSVNWLGHDLLPDWSDEWVTIERERFRQLRLHALETFCRRTTEAGQYATAIEVALSAIAADPLRESAQRVLIEAHLAEGNVSEAIRQYRSFAQLLKSALGVAPTKELRGLFS